jgi:hypothetical protein
MVSDRRAEVFQFATCRRLRPALLGIITTSLFVQKRKHLVAKKIEDAI